MKQKKLSLENILSDILSQEEEQSIQELIEDKQRNLNLSKRQLERVLNMNYTAIESLKDGDFKRFNVMNAVKIANFLGFELDRTILLIIQQIGPEAIKELEQCRKATFIANNFDLQGLKSIGFINSIQDFDKIEDRINRFFGFKRIFEYQSDLGTALFSKTRRSQNDKMKEFWVRSAYAFFEKLRNPNEYDRELLIDLIPKIKPYTQNVKYGLKTVALALRNAGVNVVYQPHLSTTQVRGATFLVNGTPSIILTDLNKNYATVWFALMHELHHVLYDLEHLESVKYHLTGDPDIFLVQEDTANEFAQEYLLSKEKLMYIKPFIHNHAMVKNCAEEWQVHPSIIYARFQYHMHELNRDYWAAFKDYFPNLEDALEGLNQAMWKEESIKESSKKLEKTISNY